MKKTKKIRQTSGEWTSFDELMLPKAEDVGSTLAKNRTSRAISRNMNSWNIKKWRKDIRKYYPPNTPKWKFPR